jgi:hypothetical protein
MGKAGSESFVHSAQLTNPLHNTLRLLKGAASTLLKDLISLGARRFTQTAVAIPSHVKH